MNELTENAKHALHFFGGMPGGYLTLDRTDLKSLLLYTDGRILTQGTLCDIQAKNLGAGVFRVTLKAVK